MIKKYYFIGIGGISMSSLAVFLKVQGNEISGSDLVESENLKKIKIFGIKYNIGHNSENITHFNPDYVVINFAINNKNEELEWAIKNKKKIITRAELLGKISKKFKHVIAISGTHGKTTTTALISEIFIEAGLKPTVHIGGILKLNNSNFLIGDKKFFITESCEYKNSFLTLSPDLGVVLNIEPDHLDFFKNIDEIQNSFHQFLENSNIKIYYKNDYKFIMRIDNNEIIFDAKNIRKNNLGYSFELTENDKLISKFQTNFFGEHNIKNAVVAIAVALYYKIKLKTIKKVIKNYHGVKRRFEKIGKINNSTVIHDYAHHPTEIKKVINQAKDFGKVLTVFQPHTYSRTKALYNEFIEAFNETNDLIIVKTYAAREDEIKGATAYDLYLSLKEKFSQKLQSDKQVSYSANFEDAEIKILANISNYDYILILGAGDIENLAKNLF